MNGRYVLSLALACAVGLHCGRKFLEDTIGNDPPKPVAAAEPARSGALPDSAFRVVWSNLIVPKTVRHASVLHFQPGIQNAGDRSWPGRDATTVNMIELGVRWIPANTAAADYATRVPLPKSLVPGGRTTLPVQITAPVAPGIYTLQFDLVQEGVSWFEWKGQPSPKFQVTVE